MLGLDGGAGPVTGRTARPTWSVSGAADDRATRVPGPEAVRGPRTRSSPARPFPRTTASTAAGWSVPFASFRWKSPAFRISGFP